MIGIIADDITGSNDVGLMYAKHGYRVEVISAGVPFDLTSVRADVLVLDTNSRCDSPELAHSKVSAAVRALLPLGCSLLFKKTCSALRGNIGTEFDAVLEATGADFAPVVAAFPKNGRTTVAGRHFIHNRPLSLSEFAQDPVNPMHLDDIGSIIRLQSARPVHLLPLETVRQGIAAVRKMTDALRPAGGYLVCDAVSQEDLKILAGAFASERLVLGSSAINEELPAFWPPPRVGLNLSGLPPAKAGALLVAGSVTPQTRSQIANARQEGILVLRLETVRLFEPANQNAEIARIVSSALPPLREGRPVLVHSPGESEAIMTTRQTAARAGLDPIQTSRVVSETLATITRDLVEEAGVNQLIVAGGETAGDICRALGITGNLVLRQIQPGLPSGLSRGRHQLLLVLKSGAFGTPGFFRDALEHLAGLPRS